ncbi:hypothetical protein DFP72DRAFT_923198 [Ephemerocybe angulata]|uniref:Transmembrane protein n=1 Tax=Ephemerocybe angulata TaxID=980116 RepID=A0A8H6HG00_9AGAR|nr:hypothetical protein DFP72DRAFT_923198 [Tulosesus angulatus]
MEVWVESGHSGGERRFLYLPPVLLLLPIPTFDVLPWRLFKLPFFFFRQFIPCSNSFIRSFVMVAYIRLFVRPSPRFSKFAAVTFLSCRSATFQPYTFDLLFSIRRFLSFAKQLCSRDLQHTFLLPSFHAQAWRYDPSFALLVSWPLVDLLMFRSTSDRVLGGCGSRIEIHTRLDGFTSLLLVHIAPWLQHSASRLSSVCAKHGTRRGRTTCPFPLFSSSFVSSAPFARSSRSTEPGTWQNS